MTITPARQGIPTIFDGIEYRSRLEARYAAWFTHLGWEFTYEPFDGNGYIPDFLVKADHGSDHGRRAEIGPWPVTWSIPGLGMPFLVEIKPAVTLADYEEPRAKIDAGLAGVWDGFLALFGADPFPCFPSEEARWLPIGLTGYRATTGVRGWDQLSVGLFVQDHFTGAPLRVSEESRVEHRDAVEAWLRELWAKACNDVKWRGRAVT